MLKLTKLWLQLFFQLNEATYNLDTNNHWSKSFSWRVVALGLSRVILISPCLSR